MKYCPVCGADVEGLLNHCDLCGTTLNARTGLFHPICYNVQECLGFGRLSFQIIEEYEPKDPFCFNDFLEKVDFKLVCWPDSLLVSQKIKERVYYSPKRKKAIIIVIIDYNDFVHALKSEKAKLVSHSVLKGLNMLNVRLKKYGHSIDDLLTSPAKTASR